MLLPSRYVCLLLLGITGIASSASTDVAALTGDGGYDGCGFDCEACCGCGSNKLWKGHGCCGGCYEGKVQGKSNGLDTCDPSTGLNPLDHRYGCVCYTPTWVAGDAYNANTFGVCEPGQYCHPEEAQFCKDTPPGSTIGSGFQLETGVHYWGSNIGSCGIYSTLAEIEAACAADSNCVGYSTWTKANTGATAVDGKYPWCLKSSEEARTIDATHNYYKKRTETVSGSGFRLETGVHYWGSNIGSCGIYSTLAEIEGACTADSNCVGYSTWTEANTGATAEDGKYPWCLKSSEEARTIDATHNYYKKLTTAE